MSQQSEYHAGERQLSLLAALTHRGLTRAQARQRIPSYAAYASRETFQRVFERDVAALRAAGYPIAVDEGDVYRYDRTAPIIAPMSALDVGLVRSLLVGLGKGGGLVGAAHSGMAKILATSEADGSAPKYLRASIPSGDDVVQIARALQYRRRISFAYEGRGAEPARYQLEPRSLAQHFDAFYVTGQARRVAGKARPEGSPTWSKRTFRISRIVPGSLSVGGPASQPPSADEQDAFAPVRAVLAVRPGAAAPLLAQGRPICPPAKKANSAPAGQTSPLDGGKAPAARDMDGLPGTISATARKGGEIAAPAGWDVVEIGPVNRQRVFEALLAYGKDVRLLGDAALLAEWRARLEHLAGLGEPSREAGGEGLRLEPEA